jgi:hypothetical protein
MSLPQLIGQDCVTCRKGIHSIAEATFCEECGNPVHVRCLERDSPPSDEKCPVCGGDPDSDIAKEVRRERGGAAQIAERRAGIVNYPVSKVCPNCKSDKYRRERPEKWVTFAWDRVCTECGMRYTPPTPMWAGVVFLVAGLLLTGLGVLGLTSGDICVGLLGLLGLGALVQAIRSLANPGKV